MFARLVKSSPILIEAKDATLENIDWSSQYSLVCFSFMAKAASEFTVAATEKAKMGYGAKRLKMGEGTSGQKVGFQLELNWISVRHVQRPDALGGVRARATRVCVA